GLLISQSLTLLSTPALYVIFSCLRERWYARRARRRERRLGMGNRESGMGKSEKPRSVHAPRG
ncbi:hypothetical protein, partial [Pantoea dispersa]